MDNLPQDLQDILLKSELIKKDKILNVKQLIGGVSSDVWKVELTNRILCIKKALPSLKVKEIWEVSIKRGIYEVKWLRKANEIIQNISPEILFQDPQNGIFIMEYFDDKIYSNWKDLLSSGEIKPSIAQKIGQSISIIHSKTANQKHLIGDFKSDDLFYELRLSPYFLHAASLNPDLAPALNSLINEVMNIKKSLVHGDISPKNILVSNDSLKILDAECAHYGDPAFDIAFCLNHLLLKSLWKKNHSNEFLELFNVMKNSYFKNVNWENLQDLERRVTRIMGGLLIGRIDGKSPVEYLTYKNDKKMVKDIAKIILNQNLKELDALSELWEIRLKKIKS